MRFVDSTSEATAGEYRDECGRLVPAESDYYQQCSGMEGVSPRFSEPDTAGSLPTMMEIYQSENLRRITGRAEIDLTGWKTEEAFDPWAFKGIESNDV